MGKFDAQNGLIHFVFANEDSYFLDNMIQLNLTDYLYYELKKKHYDYIYFVSGLQPAFCVQVFDRRSHNYCAEKQQRFFDYLLGSKVSKYEKSGQTLDCTEDQLAKLLRTAKKSAFIYKIDTFSHFFQNHSYELDRMKEKSVHDKNVILIQASTLASGSLPYFTDEKGIFQQMSDGEYLFPEIASALHAENFYQQLKIIAGDRCMFLNEFSRNNIRRVIKWLLWMQMDCNIEDISEEEIRLISEYIYAWYHSDLMHNQTRNVLSENERKSFSELADDLRWKWPMVKKQAKAWNAEQRGNFVADTIQSYVTEDGMIVKQLKSIHFPERFAEEQTQAFREWKRFVRYFETPRTAKLTAQMVQMLQKCIGRMDTAIEKNDLDTFERARAWMDDIIHCGFDYNRMKNVIWDSYEKIAELSAVLFEQNRRIDEDNAVILQLEQEKHDCIIKIRKMSEGRTRKQLEMDMVLINEKNRTVQLNKKIQKRKNILGSHMYGVSHCQELLTSLEIVVSQPEKPDINSIRKLLTDSRRMMEHNYESAQKEQQDVQEDEWNLESLLDTVSGGNLDQQFEDIAKEEVHTSETQSKLPDSIDDLFQLL